MSDMRNCYRSSATASEIFIASSYIMSFLGYVFFGSDDGRFYALNRTTGKPVWFFAPEYSLQGDVYNYITTPVLSNPIVYDKTVFLGVKGHIFALDAQTSEHPKVIVSEKFEMTLSAWILIIVVLLIIIVITSFYFSRKIRK